MNCLWSVMINFIIIISVFWVSSLWTMEHPVIIYKYIFIFIQHPACTNKYPSLLEIFLKCTEKSEKKFRYNVRNCSKFPVTVACILSREREIPGTGNPGNGKSRENVIKLRQTGVIRFIFINYIIIFISLVKLIPPIRLMAVSRHHGVPNWRLPSNPFEHDDDNCCISSFWKLWTISQSW